MAVRFTIQPTRLVSSSPASVPLISGLRAFWGSLRYEFWMQARRYSLWIVFALLAAFVLRNFDSLLSDPFITSARQASFRWATLVAEFFPLGAGLLMADRFTRDRATHMAELLDVTAATPLGRLLGKYLGATLATLVPIFLVYLVGVVLIAAHWADLSVFLPALGAFAATTVVGVLFVSAFSIACTTVMWPLLYQFLFVGYWFWGNLLNPKVGIPTLNGTILTPDGHFVLAGFFSPPPGVVLGYGQASSPLIALESLGALLSCAAPAVLAAWVWLRWQAAHQ
ncbi:MAG TPA: hypothetical protein VKQ36_02775 [Ktedonobacterales bacterium]|nr:hypothetical protein [Ktedonobacterales bacterium]